MLDAPMRDGEVRVEPAREEHREPLRSACAEDVEIWTIYPASFLDPHFDPGFEAFFDDSRAQAFVLFAGDALAGMTSFLNIDDVNRSLEIGRTYIVPRLRGTGFNDRVKRLMLDRAFGCGFARVEFRVDTRNQRSMAAVAKLGARQEGILRRNRITWTGFVRDTAVYGLLAGEWDRGV